MMLPMMGRKRQAEVTFETSKGIKDMEYIKIHAKEMYQDTKFLYFKKDEAVDSMFRKWFNKSDSNVRKDMLKY